MFESFRSLAQANVPPLEPGTLLTSGCFGLVCYIVAVLYPSESQKSRDAGERRDKLFIEVLQQVKKSADERNDKIALVVGQLFADLKAELSKHFAGLLESLDHVCQATEQPINNVAPGPRCDKPQPKQQERA